MQTSFSSVSWFSKSIYRATLRRYWAGGALLTIMLALTALSQSRSIRYSDLPGRIEQKYREAGQILSNPIAITIIIGASIVCAALVFSFMQDKRGTVMMHALPVRREAMFTSAFLGGLTLIWIPALFYLILVITAQASAGILVGPVILVWIMQAFLASLMAFSLVVFAGQLTGQISAQIFVAGLIIGLPILVELFFTFHCQAFLFGYDSSADIPLNLAANPFVFMVWLLSESRHWVLGKPGEILIAGTGIARMCIVVAFTALLIAASLLIYRKRKLEMAGEFIAVRGMRPVMRYGGAFMAAFLFEGIAMGIYGDNKAGMVVFGLIGGVLGFIIAEMFIRKSVKVFRYLKGAAAFAGCFLVFVLALIFDIAGYGRYTPPAGKVESIYFSESYYFTYADYPEGKIKPIPYLFADDAGINAALALQNVIATERPERPQSLKLTEAHEYVDGYERGRYTTYNMEATLKNGRKVTRRYPVFIEYGSRIADLTEALDDAAKPQLIERLRNAGKEASSIWLDWHGGDIYHYGNDYDYDYDGRPNDVHTPMPVYEPSETVANPVILRQNIPAFIEEMVKDNLDDPHWHRWADNRIITAQIMFDEHNEQNYSSSFPVFIFLDDHNALKWLRDNGHLAERD